MQVIRPILLLAWLALLAPPALAHTPGMRPSAFSADHEISAATAYSTDIFTPVGSR